VASSSAGPQAGGQFPHFNRVAEHIGEDGPLTRDRGGTGRAAILPNRDRVKVAPLRSAAPGRARAGLRPWEADPARRAGQPGSDLLARSAAATRAPDCEPSGQAFRCPVMATAAREAVDVAAALGHLRRERSTAISACNEGRVRGGARSRGARSGSLIRHRLCSPPGRAGQGRSLRSRRRGDGASAPLDSPALPGSFRQLSDEAPPRLSLQPGDLR
jgi:hypothetical protein